MAVNRITKLLLTLSAALVVIALACGGEAEPASAPSPAPPVDRATLHGAPPGVELPKLIGYKQYDGPPPMLIDPSKKYTAYIEMEKRNEIIIELAADKAPKTVNNFVFLARDGFYDGLNFYQVTLSGDARAGDPTGTGTGGPGYYIDDELHFDLFHKFLTVTMDNDGKPNTNGSRFMIITVGSTRLGERETRETRATAYNTNGGRFRIITAGARKLGERETGETSATAYNTDDSRFRTITVGSPAGQGTLDLRASSPTENMNGFNLDGSPKDCADPEVSCHSVFGTIVGQQSPSASRLLLIRPRNPETAETPGDVIKTIRVEVSE